MQHETTSWYQKNWFIILTVLFVFPLGLFLMWKYAKWKNWIKIALTSIGGIGLILNLILQTSLFFETTKNNTEHTSSKSNDNQSSKHTTSKYDEEMNNIINNHNEDSSEDKSDNEKGRSLKREEKAALSKAKFYATTLHLSKKGLYSQLTSEYGEKFPADAAQYAVDQIKVDYNKNALETAKTYVKDLNMSTQAVYDELVSEYGGQFTPSEAQYAIDHLDK